MLWRGLGLAAAIGIGLAACTPASEEVAMRLTSTAFEEGGSIPARYTCNGDDVSPPLTWDGAPEDVEGYALLVTDPDAGAFVHWVLAGIPADVAGLAEGEGDAVGLPGMNDFRRAGWGGPCPPSGEHRYVFTLYALSAPLRPSGTPTATELRSAMDGLVLAEASLTGVYAQR